MTVSVFLHPELIERARLVATNDAFPEVVRVLNLFENGRAPLSEAEGSCLVAFARFLLSRAAQDTAAMEALGRSMVALVAAAVTP